MRVCHEGEQDQQCTCAMQARMNACHVRVRSECIEPRERRPGIVLVQRDEALGLTN